MDAISLFSFQWAFDNTRLSRHFFNQEAGAIISYLNPSSLFLASSTSAIPGSASFHKERNFS
jgi:hypothetical protein